MNRFDIGSKVEYNGKTGIVRDKEYYGGGFGDVNPDDGYEYAVEFDNPTPIDYFPGCRRIVKFYPLLEEWVIPAGKGMWVDGINLKDGV